MAKSGADIAEGAVGGLFLVTVKYSVEWLLFLTLVGVPTAGQVITYGSVSTLTKYGQAHHSTRSLQFFEWNFTPMGNLSGTIASQAGIAKAVFHKLEYSIIEVVMLYKFRAYQSGALCGFEKQGFFSSKANKGVPPLAPSDTSSEVEGVRLTTIFKTGPPVLAKQSPDKPKKVVPLHTDNAALPAEVLKESNPPQLEEQETTSPMVVECSVVTLPSVTLAVGFVWPDVSDLIDFQEEVLPAFPIAEPMNVDDDDRPLSLPEDEAFMSLEPTFNPPAHIEVPSPPPRKYKPARQQKFADSLDEIDYSTLPAIVARPSHLEKSPEDNAPVNPKPASQNPLKRRLQKLAQSSAQQQLQEGSLDEADTSRPRKRCSAPAVGDIDEEPAAKRAKTVSSTADNVLPTPAIRKRGPSPTKPPLVALGVGGGGFGEMPNESFKALANGIAHTGVLEVEEDYGRFVKVDSRLWNKEVAAFVGERLKSHYLQEVSSFGPTLEVVAQKAESMISKIRQFLAGLDILEDAQVVQDQVASLRQSVQGSSAPEKKYRGRCHKVSLMEWDFDENLNQHAFNHPGLLKTFVRFGGFGYSSLENTCSDV
ncbi:hypothetical protein IW261DRAFT_1427981 [Armillaria novae-zelandiae]|uniref:Uncharacterized protein n=1 Tax=Armillaria novae-zelandiae TaxID=153914 RepID=A0AA39NBV3_9AGAR|nr:hypothetical protein IW261DRAFT_1427981 [Armillaria novae-zelandiae]